KKVAPTAVERNKLRRKGYAAVARLLPLSKNISGIFFFKKNKDADLKNFDGEIKTLLEKAGALG
ncbi:MAG: hypothetical protein Q7S15_00705, partial [bacterium]|nr:hypothetical protein [bacterium]